MQRESSSSDWDIVGDAEAASLMPRRESTFEDFFSSGQFHRVELADMSDREEGSTTNVPPTALNATTTPTTQRQRGPGELQQHFFGGSDADVESPVGQRKHLQSTQVPSDSTPTTPSTSGSGLPPPAGFAARPHLQLAQDTAQLPQGFPSTASVDSMFQGGGVFTHFSPFKDQKHAVGGGSHMHPSYSSSSVATPTSPPPRHFPGDVSASPPMMKLSLVSPLIASDGNATRLPVPSQAASSHARAAPSSFRPPLVPKLNLCHTSNATTPPGVTVTGTMAPSFLLSCLTPRIPLLLQSTDNQEDDSLISASSHATLRWESPLPSLVRWTVALLTLDVLHSLTSFDAAFTWTALVGRSFVLLMICGRLFRATQDTNDDALVSGDTLRERLHCVVTARADRWASTAAAAVHSSASMILDNPQSTPSEPLRPTQSWMSGFHTACRIGLLCGGLELVLGHSPVRATRLLDVAIFWVSFAALRIPLRIVVSDLLARKDGFATLQRSFIGPVGARFLVKYQQHIDTPVFRKGPSDALCWGGLQVLFAVCHQLSQLAWK